MTWAGWTEQNIAEARRLYVDEGVGAQDVATAIGAPSRSAVCGKAARMGWNAARSAESRKEYGRLTNRVTRPVQKAPAVPKPKPDLRIMGTGTVIRAAPVKPIPDFPKAPGGLRIFDPGFGGCRWPIGGAGADTRFCCASHKDGQSYCDEHRLIAAGKPVGGARELIRSVRREGGMTDAERIAALEAEVAYLRDLTGLSADDEVLAGLRHDLWLEPREALLLLTLYRAKGRPLPNWYLLDALPPLWRSEDKGTEILKVWVCRIRRKLGAGVIETVWGSGYRLSSAGMVITKRALEQRSRVAA